MNRETYAVVKSVTGLLDVEEEENDYCPQYKTYYNNDIETVVSSRQGISSMDSDNLTRASTTWLFRNPSESIEITLIKVTFQHLASLTISSRLCNVLLK
ncbi:hypothetical protein V1477_006827 [Vespula maculifrons]|uniref:Uncharacterized protein n=1 Tax=Vespula maculifrons TaxID=7453 RepID=A0ABD2CGW2_VESMC